MPKKTSFRSLAQSPLPRHLRHPKPTKRQRPAVIAEQIPEETNNYSNYNSHYGDYSDYGHYHLNHDAETDENDENKDNIYNGYDRFESSAALYSPPVRQKRYRNSDAMIEPDRNDFPNSPDSPDSSEIHESNGSANSEHQSSNSDDLNKLKVSSGQVDNFRNMQAETLSKILDKDKIVGLDKQAMLAFREIGVRIEHMTHLSERERKERMKKPNYQNYERFTRPENLDSDDLNEFFPNQNTQKKQKIDMLDYQIDDPKKAIEEMTHGFLKRSRSRVLKNVREYTRQHHIQV